MLALHVMGELTSAQVGDVLGQPALPAEPGPAPARRGAGGGGRVNDHGPVDGPLDDLLAMWARRSRLTEAQAGVILEAILAPALALPP